MLCYVAGTPNEVVYDGTDPTAFYLSPLIRLVPKRLLPDHAKQVIGNNSQLQNQFVRILKVG